MGFLGKILIYKIYLKFIKKLIQKYFKKTNADFIILKNVLAIAFLPLSIIVFFCFLIFLFIALYDVTRSNVEFYYLIITLLMNLSIIYAIIINIKIIKNHQVKFNEEKIIYSTYRGNKTEIKWENINQIVCNTWGTLFLGYGFNQVKIYQAFFQKDIFIEYLENKLNEKKYKENKKEIDRFIYNKHLTNLGINTFN